MNSRVAGSAAALTFALLSLPFVPVEAAEQKAAGHQLNLIFHGVAGFVIWPDHIEVLFPEIHDHVYKAGTWGKELRLKQGATYRLEGVEPAGAPPAIDRQKNLAFRRVSTIHRSPDKVFCSFLLPLPDAMIGLRGARTARTRPFFSGRSTSGLMIDTLPLLHTLVYRVKDVTQLGFGSALAWTPEPARDRTVNLHIWSERDVTLGPVGGRHSTHAFEALMALFPELHVKLEFSPAAKPDKNVPVKGVRSWEQWTLLERSKPRYPEASRGTRKGSEVSNCIAVIIDNAAASRADPSPVVVLRRDQAAIRGGARDPS